MTKIPFQLKKIFRFGLSFLIYTLSFPIAFSQSLFDIDSLCIENIDIPVFSNETFPKWNLDSKKIDLINNFSSPLPNEVYDMKFVYESDIAYGFLPSNSTKKLYRLEFKNGIKNPPSVTDLGNFDGTLTSPYGIEITKIHDKYYGIITNNNNSKPLFLEFENGLSESPKILSIPNFPSLVNLTAVDVFIKNDSIFGVFNSRSGNISVVNFGKDFNSSAILLKQFKNNNYSDPNGQDLYESNNTFILLNNTPKGSIGIEFLNKENLASTKSIKFDNSLLGDFNSHLYFGNNSFGVIGYSDNQNIFFAEFDTTNNNLISLRNWNIPNNGLFSKKIAFDFINDGMNDYFIVKDNRGTSTNTCSIFEIKSTNSNWKQIEYTAYNTVSKSFIYKTDSLYLYPRVKPEINLSSRCKNDTSLLSNTVTDTKTKVLGYRWKFETIDTNLVKGEIKHVFKTAGEKEIKLVTTDFCNRKDSAITRINIIPKEDIISTIQAPDLICTNSELIFKYTSQTKLDSIIQSNWNIQNVLDDTIASSSSPNLNYTFLKDEIYTISLKNIGASGCISDTSISIVPFLGPDPSFDYVGLCLYDSLSFSKTKDESNLSKVSWFLDSTLVSNQRDFKVYNDSLKTKRLSLSIENELGCASISEKIISIHPLPNAAFDSTFFCSNQNKQLFNRSTIQDFTSLTYEWYVNNNLVSIEMNPFLNIGNQATNSIKLVAKSATNCRDSVSKTIKVVPNPKANFSYDGKCLGETINFKDNSLAAQSSIANRRWTINQAILSGTSPSYTVKASGKYPVSLEITDALGCKDVKNDTVKIYELPKADFTFDNACVGKPLTFRSNSIVQEDEISNHLWSFIGLNTVLQGNLVTFTYNNSNTNLVQLEATTINGCKNAIIKPVSAKPGTKSLFSVDNTFGPPVLEINTENNSQDASSYTWKIKDGEILSTEKSPNLTFEEYGDYILQLITNNSSNCTDTSEVIINVADIETNFNISDLQYLVENDKVYFTLNVSNLGNQTLKSFDLNLDFGGLISQNQTVSVSISPNSSKTIQFPVSVDNKLFEKLSYVCLQDPTKSTTENSNLCLILSDETKNMGVYPSPFERHVNLDLYTPTEQEIKIEIFNILGELILTKNVSQSKVGKNTISLDLSSLEKNVYFIYITSGDDRIIQKIEKN